MGSTHRCGVRQRVRKRACLCFFMIFSIVHVGTAEAQRVVPLNSIHDSYPPPEVPEEKEEVAGEYDDSLAAAIAEAYASNPTLAARRYDLRATDDEIGIALSQTRPSAQLQV